jgi:hypothetical protein
MPTKKQRRRQQKSRRHEYEYVYVDDEGNEVAVDPNELRAEKNGATDSRPRQAKNSKSAPAKRSPRAIEPPTWRRAGRRALLFGPFLVLAMILLSPDVPLAQRIAPAIVMLGFFIPFSYFTDSLAYRMYRKRLGGRDTAKDR